MTEAATVALVQALANAHVVDPVPVPDTNQVQVHLSFAPGEGDGLVRHWIDPDDQRQHLMVRWAAT